MARILIAGCGYVGTAAADLFHRSGWEVHGWTNSHRSAAELSAKPYPVIGVDISSARDVGRRSENYDAVIHCASTRGAEADLYRRVYLEGARNLLDRFVGAMMIFASSTSVYGQTDGSWVTETSETRPERETSRILLEAESLILARGGTVCRLAGIYGPGRSALLRKFLDGEATLSASSDRFVNQIHRDDVASAFLHLLSRQSAGREIYNVVDDQPILRNDCLRWLAAKLGRPLLSSGGPGTVTGKRGSSNKRVSNARLRKSGWIPQFPAFADAMEKSILPSFSV